MRNILHRLLQVLVEIVIFPGHWRVQRFKDERVPIKKWIKNHMVRLLPSLGLVIVLLVAFGLIATRWILALGLRDGPFTPLFHAILATLTILPLLIALAQIRIFAADFVRKLYDLRSAAEAHNFVTRLVFGPWQFDPWLKITKGKIVVGEGNIVHRVGGPGHLVVYYDSVVITERNGRLERKLKGGGLPQLAPFEKIWEIIDLRPQFWAFEVKGMTRDGIPVSCVADVTFRIDNRILDPNGNLTYTRDGKVRELPSTAKDPYPCTDDAILRAIRSHWWRPPGWKGAPMNWAGRVVISFVEGILRNILADYHLNWLISPPQPGAMHPREEIRQRLEKELEEAARKNVGVRILSVELGEIKVDEKIPQQWIDTWKAEWESQALAVRTEGEAELLRMDIARAEAQADMIIHLIQSLRAVAASEADARPYLLAARFVDTLRWMSYDPFTRACMPPEALQTLKRIEEAVAGDRSLPRQS